MYEHKYMPDSEHANFHHQVPDTIYTLTKMTIMVMRIKKTVITVI